MNGEQNEAQKVDSPAAQPPEADEGNAAAQEQESTPATPAPQSNGNAFLEWTASDTAGQGIIIGVAVIAALLVLALTRDVFSVVAVIAAALLYVVLNKRQPHVMQYRLDASGISISRKRYPYDYFRSFSVVDEPGAHNIALYPLKRFMPVLTLYYTPENETAVIEYLADRLPLEAHRRDAVDTVAKRLGF